MRHRFVGVVVLGVLSVGCSSPVGEPEPAPSPTESVQETTPQDSAVEVYHGMWDVVVEASHAGDPDPAELQEYASGQALELMRQTLEGAAEEQAEVEGEPVLNPEVVDSTADTVTILDCADGSDWVESDSESEVGEGGRREIDATVTHDGLSWRVSELRIWEPGTC